MKILITHERFPPDFYGGGERVVYELAKRLQLNNFDVSVLTVGDPKIVEYDGIPTVRLPIHRYLMNLAFPWIYKYAKKADIIQTNSYNACFPSLLAGRLLKKPVICLVHSVWRDKWLEMRGILRGNISRLVEKIQLARKYTKVIFFSDASRDEGLQLGISEELTKVILLGINYEKYQTKKKGNYILFVGRLAKQKGIDDLIEAARGLPSINFKLVGTGEEESRIKSILPPNVELLGYVSEEKLLDLYSRAPIFCLPSVAETFGLVALEAMASGCAIVSTVPLDFEGIKLEQGNVEQLKEGLNYLTNNRDITEQMGKTNRIKARSYSWDSFAQQMIDLYREILEIKLES